MNVRILLGITVVLLLIGGMLAALGVAQVNVPQAQAVRVGDYASHSGAMVRFTILGPVVANEQYTSNSIEVTPSQRTVTVYQTYQNQVTFVQSYPNNQAAFTQFVEALQVAGFSVTRASNQTTPDGNCAIGNRYIYQLYDGGNQVMSSWATSCATSSRTFNGDIQSVNSLFQHQIPNLTNTTQYQSVIPLPP